MAEPEVITPPTPDPNAVPEWADNLKNLVEASMAETQSVRAELEEMRKPAPAPVKPEEDPENQPFSTPKQVRDEMRGVAKQTAKQILEEAEAEKERMRQADLLSRQQLDENFDKLLDEATKDGLIAPIGNRNDESDQGLADRREVFGLAAYLGTSNLKQVASLIKDKHDKGEYFEYNPTAPLESKFVKRGEGGQPARQNTPPPKAPVGSSNARVTAPNNAKPTYEMIHNSRSIDDLLKKAGY